MPCGAFILRRTLRCPQFTVVRACQKFDTLRDLHRRPPWNERPTPCNRPRKRPRPRLRQRGAPFDEQGQLVHSRVSHMAQATSQASVFITGSNFELLAGELATLLNGRYVSFQVMPFLQQPEGRSRLHRPEQRRNAALLQRDGYFGGKEGCSQAAATDLPEKARPQRKAPASPGEAS